MSQKPKFLLADFYWDKPITVIKFFLFWNKSFFMVRWLIVETNFHSMSLISIKQLQGFLLVESQTAQVEKKNLQDNSKLLMIQCL